MYNGDYNYAGTRLNGTIVRNNGSAVRVKRVGADGRCIIQNLSDGLLDFAQLEDLDLKPVPLGYVMYCGKYHYLSRIPRRDDWRQGLRDNTMHLTPRGAPNKISGRDLVDCVSGNWPSYVESKEQVRRGHDGIPFHRNWKMTQGGGIEYKGMFVAYLDQDENVIWESGYKHLKEALGELM